MTSDTQQDAQLNDLRKWLKSELTSDARKFTFDMADEPEKPVLQAFPALQQALDWLGARVTQPWREADRSALQSQSRHRLLARISICAGTAAIVLAIAQLRIQGGRVGDLAQALEAVAVLGGVVAVGVGLKAKFDRRWLGQRHRAERLRMLKFRSLGHPALWCADVPAWQQWVESELQKLQAANDFSEVKRWSTLGDVEPTPAPRECATDPRFAEALTSYYRSKRLDFQARFFSDRCQQFIQKTKHWRHLSLPLFLLSVLCALSHFGSEYLAGVLKDTPAGHPWEIAAMWFVASAAVIPVLGLGVRAWFAAFELPRSTSLYSAKSQALIRASEQLQADSGDASATLRHIAQNEHFLEHEHREWLRLLLDTEWFL